MQHTGSARSDRSTKIIKTRYMIRRTRERAVNSIVRTYELGLIRNDPCLIASNVYHTSTTHPKSVVRRTIMMRNTTKTNTYINAGEAY